MKKIEFNEENFGHCHCGSCPVQGGSECAKAKLEKYPNYQEAAKNPQDGAKVYCSIDISECGDLKEKMPCLCPTCLVWYENKLGKLHYCTKGSAKERD